MNDNTTNNSKNITDNFIKSSEPIIINKIIFCFIDDITCNMFYSIFRETPAVYINKMFKQTTINNFSDLCSLAKEKKIIPKDILITYKNINYYVTNYFENLIEKNKHLMNYDYNLEYKKAKNKTSHINKLNKIHEIYDKTYFTL